MRRWQLALAVLAVSGWLGTLTSQLAILWTDDDETLAKWTVRRNQFLLLSSLSTNSLALSAVYRYVNRTLR